MRGTTSVNVWACGMVPSYGSVCVRVQEPILRQTHGAKQCVVSACGVTARVRVGICSACRTQQRVRIIDNGALALTLC